jgi:Domain of unknown function (DUF4303)
MRKRSHPGKRSGTMAHEFQADPPKPVPRAPREAAQSREDNPFHKDRRDVAAWLVDVCVFAGGTFAMFLTGAFAFATIFCIPWIADGHHQGLLLGCLFTSLTVACGYLVHRIEARTAARRRDRLFREIRRALWTGAARSLDALQRDRPGEAMYAFLFEVNVTGDSVSAVAATEEGLDRLTQKYLSEGYRAAAGDSAVLCRQWLRWQEPGGKWYLRGALDGNEGWYTKYQCDYFKEAQIVLRRAFQEGHMRQRDETLIRLCLETLQAMDARGEFDEYVARERLVLGVFDNGKHADEKQFLEWAAQVNPPGVLERLRLDMAAGKAAGEAMVPPTAEPPASEFAF